MIDAAKLDEIEREAQVSDAYARAIRRGISVEWIPVKTADALALCATAREALALRRLIDEHNARCEAECAARPQGFCYRYKHSSKGRCPDCPRLGEIHLSGIKEPGAC